MPVEIEVPTEHLHEAIHKSAHGASEEWVMPVALSSAVLAVLAAISALLSGHHANEALIEQIQAANKWAYYQSKGIKAAVLSSKMELLASDSKAISDKDLNKLAEYKKEQEEIKKSAEEKEEVSKKQLKLHETLSTAVTLYQIGIALGAISLLTKRKEMWYASLLVSFVGTFFLVLGLF